MELSLASGVHYQFYSGIAQITLAIHESKNALNITTLQQLVHWLKEAHNNADCRVIVLMAKGDNFCRGLDLEWAFAAGQQLDPEIFKLFMESMLLIHRGPLPVIACLEGDVTAGGLGLVAACDMVLALDKVKFMLSEVIVGMIPALVTPFLLLRLSFARINYMALSTREVLAPEAHQWGLVDEVATDSLAIPLERQLQRLLRSSPQAIAESKRYFQQLNEETLPLQLAIALETIKAWVQEPEVAAGIQDFAEGLAPVWFQKYRKQPYV